MPELSKYELLSNLYYDLDEGHGSAQAVYNQSQHKNVSITLDYVNTWSNTHNQINKETDITATVAIKHHFQD